MTQLSRAVLITGCSSGIGRATALRLADAGWPVWASARRVESIADLGDAGCRLLALDVTDEASMTAAVAEVERAGRGGRRADQQRRLQPERRRRDGPARRRPQAVRDERLRARAGDAAGTAGDARAGLGQGRQHRLDGRPPDLPGRRLVPRDQVRARSALRRAAVRGRRLRRRRDPRRAGPDHDLVRRDGGRVAGGGERRPTRPRRAATAPAGQATARRRTDPYAHFNATVGAVTKGAYEGPLRLFGGGPERVAKAIDKAITRRRAPTRVVVTPSARTTIPLRRILPDRAWDAAMRQQFPQPR